MRRLLMRRLIQRELMHRLLMCMFLMFGAFFCTQRYRCSRGFAVASGSIKRAPATDKVLSRCLKGRARRPEHSALTGEVGPSATNAQPTGDPRRARRPLHSRPKKWKHSIPKEWKIAGTSHKQANADLAKGPVIRQPA